VLALGPGLDACESVLDGEIDGLVVAGFEMQEFEGPVGAPVAPVERFAAEEVEGAATGVPSSSAMTRRMRSAMRSPIASKKARVR
jgi:hypothetical protein